MENASRRVGILGTKHTAFITELLKHSLSDMGLECSVKLRDIKPGGSLRSSFLLYDRSIPYIIVCPQYLKTLPKCFSVFQMEQINSSAWLDDAYLSILRKAETVFDYSHKNIAALSMYPELAPKLRYLPVDYNVQMLQKAQNITETKEYDVAFYGAVNSRREEMLKPIADRFNTKILKNVFGDELYSELRKAKVVVNIHFYEDALLETTRLYEVLSLGESVIVSEKSSDSFEDERLKDTVDFVDIGDSEAMVRRVAFWVENFSARSEKLRMNREKGLQSGTAFSNSIRNAFIL